MKSARRTQPGFTLIELMLVVAILGIVLTMSYPAISGALHRAPLTQAVVDITDACREARKHAILQDKPTEMRIYGDGRIEVIDSPSDVVATLNDEASTVPTGPKRPAILTDNDVANPSAIASRHLSENVAVELIAVNFADLQGSDVARVHFYPNGTCDEFTVVIFCNGERRKISLESVTALSDVQSL